MPTEKHPMEMTWIERARWSASRAAAAPRTVVARDIAAEADAAAYTADEDARVSTIRARNHKAV